MIRYWWQTLSRRSQNGRITRKRIRCLADWWLPRPRILHPWPTTRFDARTRGALTRTLGSVRGAAGERRSLPRSIDPDSELITATTVTAGNVGDARPAAELLSDELVGSDREPAGEPEPAVEPRGDQGSEDPAAEPVAVGERSDRQPVAVERPERGEREAQRLSVYGDSAYGSGELLGQLEQADAEINCKVQPPVAPGGRFAKDAFTIDLQAGTVSCPAGHTVALEAAGDGQIAQFATACTGCPLAAKCTTSSAWR